MPSKQEWQHVLVELFELIDMEELIEEMEIANWDVIAGWDESAVGGGINIIVIFEYHCFTVIERLNRWTLRLPLLFQLERLPQACLLLRLACWVILCSYSHLKNLRRHLFDISPPKLPAKTFLSPCYTLMSPDNKPLSFNSSSKRSLDIRWKMCHFSVNYYCFSLTTSRLSS